MGDAVVRDSSIGRDVLGNIMDEVVASPPPH